MRFAKYSRTIMTVLVVMISDNLNDTDTKDGNDKGNADNEAKMIMIMIRPVPPPARAVEATRPQLTGVMDSRRVRSGRVVIVVGGVVDRRRLGLGGGDGRGGWRGLGVGCAVLVIPVRTRLAILHQHRHRDTPGGADALGAKREREAVVLAAPCYSSEIHPLLLIIICFALYFLLINTYFTCINLVIYVCQNILR